MALSARIQHDALRGRDVTVITGAGAWEASAPAAWTGPAAVRSIERLHLRLAVRKTGSAAAQRVLSGALGFAPTHPDYWNALPDDAALYTHGLPDGRVNPHADLWRSVEQPRFPLAGGYSPTSPEMNAGLFIPLPAGEGLYLPPLYQSASALERSGLAEPSVDLFLDPLLQGCGVETLTAQADYLSYQSPQEHQPRGIYAALRLEEATLIAVPDVLHAGWERDTSLPPVPEPAPPPAPDMECQPPLPEDARGHFTDSNPISAPVLMLDSSPLSDGVSQVRWTPASGPAVLYRLEEAIWPDFSGASALYVGAGLAFTLPPRGPGAYYYRVRAESAPPGPVGPWSEGIGVRLGAVRPWKTLPPTDLREDDLARFHSALLTLCAARGDLFAVLDLPAHYHEDQALRYAARLKNAFAAANTRTASFGALYHPWLYSQEEERGRQPLLAPPSGPVCGMVARRTLARGAWLAPANEPLTGIVAAEPRIAAARYLDLQEGAVNIIRQEARGFLALSEATLSADSELELVHVRRLLMLLHRLALREGAMYVFEPNSPAFRRQVQRGFEDMLAGLFRRGAFSGITPAEAYQVDVGERLNPPSAVDLGRLVVEIRVAPAQPLVFLTIRLVQTGAREFSLQEGAV